MAYANLIGPAVITGAQDTDDKRRPLDDRYGPYDSLDDAMEMVYGDGSPIDNSTYYGLTIGVYRKTGNIILGLDEYWWQPRCVKSGNAWVDGFILKYPANTINTVTETDAPNMVLEHSSENNKLYNN